MSNLESLNSYCATWVVTEQQQIPTVSRFVGRRDGGGEWIEKPVVMLEGVSTQLLNAGVEFTFLKDGAFAEADITRLGFPEDWRCIDGVQAEVVNGPVSLMLQLTLVTGRGRFRKSFELEPNETATLTLPIPDLPLGQGIQPDWEPTALRIGAQWGDTWPTEGALVVQEKVWHPTAGNEPVTLNLQSLQTIEREPPPYVVDRFGQRVSQEWEGKIHSEQDLIDNREKEALSPPLFGPEQAGNFGGRKDLPAYTATGFFRVEQDPDGPWWLVDPEGFPFFSVGTTGVRMMDTTITTGREELFESLPEQEGPHGDARNPKVNSPANDPKGKETVAFYGWNVLRKYGNASDWGDQVIRRFRSWGYNTLGNWSELDVFGDKPFPFTVSLSTRRPEAGRIGKSLPDVFDSAWEPAFREHVKEEAAKWKDNPWVLGYFVDNEMGWGILDDENRKEFSERYFRTVSATLKEFDPHHMYLGCRFTRRVVHPDICAAAGRYCDVVTVNSYDLWPRREEFSQWHELTGKPILIGEHHTPLECERQVPPPYPAFTSEEREQLYKELVEKWAAQPWAVGCHWYQHADQHLTGRPNDGENQPVGVVDITDTPYEHMVKAITHATRHMYEWHGRAR